MTTYLKKTGVTLVAGSFVGLLASATLGGELVASGDYGNFQSPYPDGAADRVLVDTMNYGVEFVYTQGDGLNIIDTSGQLVEAVVDKAGSGYGKNINGSAKVGYWSNNAS
ncbi:MAG: hypothetical protein MK116_08765, partial [Phycisphaerales bacterium]|nr:hypothetical protein [Phycisphaerales bacterium]